MDIEEPSSTKVAGVTSKSKSETRWAADTGLSRQHSSKASMAPFEDCTNACYLVVEPRGEPESTEKSGVEKDENRNRSAAAIRTGSKVGLRSVAHHRPHDATQQGATCA